MVEVINKRIREQGIAAMTRWAEQNDIGTWHRNTVSRHKNIHMTEPHERERAKAVEAMKRQQRQIKGPSTGDLASLVRDNVFGRVTAGELEPTIAEGLRAQEMLDRRTEKGADRDLMVRLAAVLSGSGGLALPAPAVEGSFVELDDEAEEDTSLFARLLEG